MGIAFSAGGPFKLQVILRIFIFCPQKPLCNGYKNLRGPLGVKKGSGEGASISKAGLDA